MKTKTILYILFFLALLGLATSIYLTHLHYLMFDSICDFNAQFSCTSISQSAYAKIFNIPISVLGIIGYSIFALIPLVLLLKKKFSFIDLQRIHPKLTLSLITRTYFLMALGSLLFSFYLTYLELHTINVVCPLCIFSQIIILIILFFSYIIHQKISRGKNEI